MGNGATTRTVGLLERSEQLDALDGHLAAVREQGRGRLVLIAGEAGIGKTALVRAFCGAAAAAAVLWGACDALFTPRPLGPFVDIAERAGGELGAAVGRGRGARARSLAALTRRCAAGRPTSSSSRTCTGPTRRPSTSCASSPAASRRSRRSWSPPTATTSSTARHPLRIVLGELPARAADAAGAGAAVGRRASPSSPARRGRPRASCIGGPPATRSSSPRSWPRPTARSPRPSATPCSPAPRASTPGAERCSTPSRSCRRAPSCGCSRRSPDGELDGLDGCLASGMLRAERDAVALPPRDRARRGRGGARAAPARARSTASALARARGPRRAPRPRAPRPPRRGGRRRASRARATRRPPASARPRSGPTARRPRSSRARCATLPASPSDRRAELLERRSYECYLTDDIAERHRRPAARARRARAAGDTGCARATRIAGCRAWPGSRATTRRPSARRARAVELLEPLAPGRELAMAYSNMAQLRMLASDQPGASAWGERAIALAERLGRDRDRRPRAEQRRRRGAARGLPGGSREARAQPRPRARGRPRGARRPRVHEPRAPASCARDVRDRRRYLDGRDRVLRRARPDVLGPT